MAHHPVIGSQGTATVRVGDLERPAGLDPLVESYGDRLEDLEDRIATSCDDRASHDLHALRRDLQTLAMEHAKGGWEPPAAGGSHDPMTRALLTYGERSRRAAAIHSGLISRLSAITATATW